jgi:hypothetical protein
MDWALLVASMALVFVTVVYTVYTSRMVNEMKATRLLSVHPRLSLAVNMRSAAVGEIAIVNIGHGQAIDSQVTLEVAALQDERHWRAPLLAPGERAVFMLEAPGEPHKVVSMQEATDLAAVVELCGTTGDLYGTRHDVRETFDLAAWWRGSVAAQEGFREGPDILVPRELQKLREATEEIGEHLARRTT